MLRELRAVRGRVREGYYGFLKPPSLARHAAMYARDCVGRRRYRLLSEEELLATRTSDTAFVFGSGRSLLDVGEDEWAAIARCNTISLREFPRQRWVRADYHVTGEIDLVDDYARRIRENPLYADAVFVVQEGFISVRANELVGRGLLPHGARVFRYSRRDRARNAPPSRSPRELVHGYNSMFDATNLAVALGYRRIVLAGADYYNKEYFWLSPDEQRAYEKPGIRADEAWPQAEPIVAMLGDWHDLLAPEGVQLFVHNPRSLLASRLPVFAW